MFNGTNTMKINTKKYNNIPISKFTIQVYNNKQILNKYYTFLHQSINQSLITRTIFKVSRLLEYDIHFLINVNLEEIHFHTDAVRS